MNFVDFTKLDIVKAKTASSKGNQLKWLHNNKWYKLDHMGYEGLSEVVVSQLLKKSNITNYVSYKPIKIKYKLTEKAGCYSDNFKDKDEIIITLERLFKLYTGKSLAKELAQLTEIEDRIKYTVDFVEKITGLQNVGEYFAILIELDAFFLNEDRHTNNIALIKNEKADKYSFCPYFDFGLSLLSDTNDYPLNASLFDCIEQIKSKPFSTSFDEQLDAVENLYGSYIGYTFDTNDINNALNMVAEYYDPIILERVQELLFRQKRKYSYMFKK